MGKKVNQRSFEIIGAKTGNPILTLRPAKEGDPGFAKSGLEKAYQITTMINSGDDTICLSVYATRENLRELANAIELELGYDKGADEVIQ